MLSRFIGDVERTPRALAYPLLAIGMAAALGAVHTNIVRLPQGIFAASLALTFLALAALVYSLVYVPLRDNESHRLLPYGLAMGFFLIAAVRLASTSFAHGDEIYSWNMWAVQHYMRQPADYWYTGAAYPQLLPYWIASIYGALGSTVVHAVPRFFVAISTLVFFLAIMGAGSIRSWRKAGVVAFIAICVWGPLLMRDELPTAMADPMMSAFFLASVALVIRYEREPGKLVLLWLAAACAVMSAFTKQPALLWGCLALPLVVAAGCFFRGWPKRGLAIALVAALVCIAWPLLIAPHFANNPGVIQRSTEGRSYLDQLGYAGMKYLVQKPGLLILFAASAIFAWRHWLLRLLWITALLPMLVAWFLFGAYNLRLGMHVVGLAALLLVAAIAPARPGALPSVAPARRKAAAIAGLATFAIFATAVAGALMLAASKGTDLADGNRTTFRTQFGPGSEAIFDRLAQSNARVWTTTNYSYGALFGRMTVGRPAYRANPYDISAVVDELESFGAQYAIYAGTRPYGAASELLKQLAAKCPKSLPPALIGDREGGGFILYKVDLASLAAGNCQ
jgi:hypothetical protein